MRKVELRRAITFCHEGKRFYDAGEAIAIDYNAYDQTLGFNLTSGHSFTMSGWDFDGRLVQIGIEDLTEKELEEFRAHDLSLTYSLYE